MAAKENNSYKKFLMTLTGAVLVVVGMTLILTWWEDVVRLFRGFTGIALAFAGMVMLYFVKK
jgi:hypothetical protein